MAIGSETNGKQKESCFFLPRSVAEPLIEGARALSHRRHHVESYVRLRAKSVCVTRYCKSSKYVEA